MRISKFVATALFSLFLIAAIPLVASAAKKTTPKVKLYTMKTVTTSVPSPKNNGTMFNDNQLVNARCGSGYLPLSIGIASAQSPFAAQDLGFFGMSVYATGVGGKAKNKLQALCVKGGKTPSYIGKAVKLSTLGGELALTATLKCKRGTVALGAGLAHGHAPAIGRYRSMPDNPREWSYRAKIDSYNAGIYKGRFAQLGYPRAACVRATGVSSVDYEGLVGLGAPAEEQLSCKQGRALGWGVDLMPFRSNGGSDGRWAIPIIEQAKFVGKSAINFKFTRGTDTAGFSSPTYVRAVLICGNLPKG